MAISALLLAAGPASADTLSTPSLSGPLTANPNPMGFDAGPLGRIYVGGIASGFGALTSDPESAAGDRHWRWDASNGEIFIQKTGGLLQFYVQAGAYNLPSLGTPLFATGKETGDLYSPVPVAYAKFAPTSSFSILAGKLPALIGAESTFTFQNMNIERGLLWNQEPAISRGVQANYASGPISLSLSWNDGFYSNDFSWLSGLATWTIDSSNSISLVGSGNLDNTTKLSFATPLYQNNSEILNLVYTYSESPWTVTPYLQYTNVPPVAPPGPAQSGRTYGAAVLATYNLSVAWNLSGRIEYIEATGSAAAAAPNLLYGPGSKAWSFTITPTWQSGIFFVRPEASLIALSNATEGAALGSDFNARTQFRALVEAGVLF
ncbi:MAG TPA: outer membrane beta-barrel protein [Rhizomicrobium sp.]|jgi:hypothetical protein|nr:outer membrane beta-barrel protein [Rhizomicrobium sp.]